LLLSACGSSSSGLTLSGTSAKGAPLEGTVIVTCKSGSGSVSTNGNGFYTISLNPGEGPCLVKLTPKDGSAPLYSISSGTSTQQVANVTAMTNLLVNYLENVPGVTATTPEAWFALSTTQYLLGTPTVLNNRIVNDFIPAMKTLVPSLALTSTGFLDTSFTASTTPTAPDDIDLEKLLTAAVVSSTGQASTTTVATLKADAGNDPVVVVPTGGVPTN